MSTECMPGSTVSVVEAGHEIVSPCFVDHECSQYGVILILRGIRLLQCSAASQMDIDGRTSDERAQLVGALLDGRSRLGLQLLVG